MGFFSPAAPGFFSMQIRSMVLGMNPIVLKDSKATNIMLSILDADNKSGAGQDVITREKKREGNFYL